MKFRGLLGLFLSLCLVFGCNIKTGAAALTVSSECSIEDIDVPLETIETSAAVGQTLDIKAKSAFLIEPNSGKILYEANSDEKLPPASITKIMSLLLVMEALDRKDITMETVVSASEHACSMGGSQIWLEPGEAMTVHELLKAAVIASANDATVALGELIAGGEEGFFAMMNERAIELGMTNTNFINCTGLDAEGHITTAHDVGLMSAELIKHDTIKEYSTVWMDTLRDGKSELVNTNKLVRFYEGTTGLKTGTTSGAGYCLSATAQRDGMELVAVIMGGDTSNDRFNGAKKLLDYGFANYAYCEVEPEIPENFCVKVKDGVKKTVKVLPDGNYGVLMLKSEAGKLTQHFLPKKQLSAPVKKGESAGIIEIKLQEETVGIIELRAKNDVERKNFGVTLWWIVKDLFIL